MKQSLPSLIQHGTPLPDVMSKPNYNIPPPEYRTEVDLRQFWRTIKRHIWLALSVPLAFVVLVTIHDLMATRLYTAQAMILIKRAAPQVFKNDSIDGRAGNEDSGSQWSNGIETEYTLIGTRSLAEQVILSEGLNKDPAFAGEPGGDSLWHSKNSAINDDTAEPLSPVPPSLIDRYLASLKVSPIEDTELVKIIFTTPNAGLSARLANAHVREFIQQGIELNSQTSDQAATFLRAKLAQLKRQVEESELALNNYRRDKGIIPGLISMNGQEVVLGRLDKLSEQTQRAHLENLNFETQVALINQGHENALPAIVDSGIVQNLKQSLDALQTQYVSMSGQFKPDYPPMIAIGGKIKGTRDALAREIDSITQSIKAQYAANLKDEQALDDELKSEKTFALGLNDAAVKYEILQREVDTNNELYNAVLKRMKDVEVAADLHSSNVSIVDRATAPLTSSSPRKARNLMAAMLLGLMAGIGLTVIIDRHDDTFTDSAEIEDYLRVPLLGMVPDFYRLRRTVYGPKLSRSPGPSGPPIHANGTILSIGGRSPVGETYRMLRTALMLSRPGSPPKSVLIASAVPSEGKTTTATNLAIVLAGTGKKIILIDADLRRPHCHELFALENHCGLTEALTGSGEIVDLIRPTSVGNLYLLSSGETPPNPSELLGSDRMRAILLQLGNSYDCIIIDSAPVLPVTDAVVLSSIVDGVIVVAGRQTRRQCVKAALSRLDYAQAKVLGIVLNKVEAHNLGYQDYNGDYYSYENGSRRPAEDGLLSKES